MARPKITVRFKKQANDHSAVIRIARIENGFLIKTGGDPVYFSDMDTASASLRDALLEAASAIEPTSKASGG